MVNQGPTLFLEICVLRIFHTDTDSSIHLVTVLLSIPLYHNGGSLYVSNNKKYGLKNAAKSFSVDIHFKQKKVLIVALLLSMVFHIKTFLCKCLL